MQGAGPISFDVTPPERPPRVKSSLPRCATIRSITSRQVGVIPLKGRSPEDDNSSCEGYPELHPMCR